MSVQSATEDFGRHGHDRSWAVVCNKNYDASTGLLETGLYYGNQNARTGDIFFGGEKARTEELLSADDEAVMESCKENISTVLPRYFPKGWEEGQRPEVKSVWSGIMGFTADRMPLVGRLAESVTERGGETGAEYIAAGFNGYGMPLCWGCGEVVAKMVMGQDVDDRLPRVFLATEERLREIQSAGTGPALAMLLGGLS